MADEEPSRCRESPSSVESKRVLNRLSGAEIFTLLARIVLGKWVSMSRSRLMQGRGLFLVAFRALPVEAIRWPVG